MKTAVSLSFVALVACSSAGMLGLRLHQHDRPTSKPVAAQLQSVLVSAALQAVPFVLAILYEFVKFR